MGNAESALGRIEQAKEHYNEAIAIARMIKDDPADSQAKRGLSVLLNKLAGIQMNEGEQADAVRSIEESIAVARQNVDADPANMQAKRDLGVSYIKAMPIFVATANLERWREASQGAVTQFEAVLRTRRRTHRPRTIWSVHSPPVATERGARLRTPAGSAIGPCASANDWSNSRAPQQKMLSNCWNSYRPRSRQKSSRLKRRLPGRGVTSVEWSPLISELHRPAATLAAWSCRLRWQPHFGQRRRFIFKARGVRSRRPMTNLLAEGLSSSKLKTNESLQVTFFTRRREAHVRVNFPVKIRVLLNCREIPATHLRQVVVQCG